MALATYMTRVELHHATVSDYETLHNAMRAKGFSHTIHGGDGKEYYLPPAEYYLKPLVPITRAAVLALAQAAAGSTKRKNAIVVTETNDSITWTGLEIVQHVRRA